VAATFALAFQVTLNTPSLAPVFALPVCEIILVVVLYIQFVLSNKKRSKEVGKYIEGLMCDVNSAAADSLLSFPMPMCVVMVDSNEIIWCNNAFYSITGEHEHTFGLSLNDAVPNFNLRWIIDGKSECPNLVSIGEKKYTVLGSIVSSDDKNASRRDLMVTLYWYDNTEVYNIREEYQSSRQIVALIVIDNYEEISNQLDDSERSRLVAAVDSKVWDWAKDSNGILIRYERDKLLFVFEERYLKTFLDGKFSILEEVHTLLGNDQIPVTLSIGVGRDGDNYIENFKAARLAVDMALSRGGDQAVVRNKFNFEFFGGTTREFEKRTKVKSRVMAGALGELVKDSSSVFIMGHRGADIDSIGSAIGLVSACRMWGVQAQIVLDPNDTGVRLLREHMMTRPEYENVFVEPNDALLRANTSSLLIIVDTNRPDYVSFMPLLESCNRVAVIDHHRRAAEYIQNAVLNFHEPYASSTAELVTELLQYISSSNILLRAEADALLAGIVLDTKNFTMKTGMRTFEAAAYLRRCGADTVEVKKLFQRDFENYIARADLVKQAHTYRDIIAISKYEGRSDRITASQAADDMLNISGIEASFVLFVSGDQVVICARSLGQINVQVVLERLGGGGHLTNAGAQIKDMELDEAYAALLASIDENLTVE